jgi:hypothetical protein
MLQYVHSTYIMLLVKIMEGSIICTREKVVIGYFVDIFKSCIVLVFYLSDDP